jgi:cellulose synthase/poly-beta-1,6-N-acetylglucosamine synthase-like glycosyltransferase
MPATLLEEPPLRPIHEPFHVDRVLSPVAPLSERKHKVIAVLPAYNAEKTLAATIADFPPGCVDEILLVDDGSKDNTVAIARSMGLKVIVHEQNKG